MVETMTRFSFAFALLSVWVLVVGCTAPIYHANDAWFTCIAVSLGCMVVAVWGWEGK